MARYRQGFQLATLATNVQCTINSRSTPVDIAIIRRTPSTRNSEYWSKSVDVYVVFRIPTSATVSHPENGRDTTVATS